MDASAPRATFRRNNHSANGLFARAPVARRDVAARSDENARPMDVDTFRVRPGQRRDGRLA